MKPTRTNTSILRQLCDLIPGHLVPKLARKHGVDKKCRTFSPWSHVLSLIHSQLAHSLSLNDICDSLSNHSSELKTIREATPPSRNGLSHANKTRDSAMGEELFWKTLDHLRSKNKKFGGGNYKGMPRRFKKTINVVDSSTISLVANCMDWAKHRRRKAAAKMHLRLDLQSFLPTFAVIDAAKHSDPKKAYGVCAGIKDGEIVLFDKAYVDFKHLYELEERGVFWVTRAKGNMTYEVVEDRTSKTYDKIDKDLIIQLTCNKSKKNYPETLRLVKAYVEIDGKEVLMTFITNNKKWSPNSVCDLYKSRWAIEVFFKQIKQTLQLGDFLGHSENAVKWQIWTALLVYVLLRFVSFTNQWGHSFNRLFTMIRGVLWMKFQLDPLIQSYGTASDPPKMNATPEQAYLPGFS